MNGSWTPPLVIPSLQVNIRAGHLPPANDSGKAFLKVQINALTTRTTWSSVGRPRRHEDVSCQIGESARRVYSGERSDMRRFGLKIPVMTRRLVAALVAVVMSLAPLLGTLDAATAAMATGKATAQNWSRAATSAPKPCKKAVLPGTINSCPYAGAIFTAIPADENATAQPVAASRTLTWRRYDDALATQCDASSPYRPPCRRS